MSLEGLAELPPEHQKGREAAAENRQCSLRSEIASRKLLEALDVGPMEEVCAEDTYEQAALAL
jgi:hypothetical protein